MTDVFDFTAFEDVTSADVRIKDPITGASTAMVVSLAGPEHAERKRLTALHRQRLRAEIFKVGKLHAGSAEDEDADAVEMLVVCTLGWTGAPVPYSKDAARALYADPKRRWLREQVQAALNERELFTRSSAAN